MKLKVISFNIRCLNDPNGYSRDERAPRILKVVEPYDADVIGLQEYIPAWESHIEANFGDKYDIYNQYRCREGWIESPPILWKKDKFECIKQGCFWLSDTPEVESFGWDTINHNRNCLYVILKDKESGECFTFMNTHFGFGDEGQKKSAALICEYAKKISELPTFVTGDFNANPDTSAYAEMTSYFTDANAVTAKDWRSTFHAYDLEKETNEHIDYCFVDSRIKPLASHLMDETVDGKFPSDHFGLYTEIEL